MKNIKCVCFMALVALVFTGCMSGKGNENQKVLSQEDLLNKMTSLFEEADTYKKYKQVYARNAIDGEKIVTVTSDGKETENTAAAGDLVVKNSTDAAEEYVMSGDKFNSRYVLETANIDADWSLYNPLGEVKGLEVNNELLTTLGETNDSFYIMAAWGQEMVVKAGDFLVTPLDYSEVYRIANKEFFETYTKK